MRGSHGVGRFVEQGRPPVCDLNINHIRGGIVRRSGARSRCDPQRRAQRVAIAKSV